MSFLGKFIHEIKTKGYDVIDVNVFLNKLMTRQMVMVSLLLWISAQVNEVPEKRQKNMALLALMFSCAIR